jgi:hypothetical protein
MSASAALSQPVRLFVLALVFALAGSAEANAQQASQTQISAVRAACRSDYMAHCASVPPGGKAALACLQKNVSSLSPSCQSAVNAMNGGAAAPAATEKPPSAPAAAAPAEPTPPAAAATAAPAEPTPPAAAATAAPSAAAAPAYPPMSPRQEMMILRRSCGPDYRALCGGVPPGGGRVVACLRANGPSLSPQCRHAIMSALGG